MEILHFLNWGGKEILHKFTNQALGLDGIPLYDAGGSRGSRFRWSFVFLKRWEL